MEEELAGNEQIGTASAERIDWPRYWRGMIQECPGPKVYCARARGTRKYDTKVCGTGTRNQWCTVPHEPGTIGTRYPRKIR